MSIGILIAAWMAGGVIPTMVYYGLQIISPRFFLVTALLLCSLVSLAIGSSLSTIGTVGVALFGIGSALGIPPAITAGAIVSGAYFGIRCRLCPTPPIWRPPCRMPMCSTISAI